MRRTIMRHRLGILEPMADVPNISGVIEQIDHAADLATSIMRSHGRILAPGRPDVPVQDETDTYLRALVLEAYSGFIAAKEEAITNHQPPPDSEIEGYAGDDRHFEVMITGLESAPHGHLTVDILFRIS